MKKLYVDNRAEGETVKQAKTKAKNVFENLQPVRRAAPRKVTRSQRERIVRGTPLAEQTKDLIERYRRAARVLGLDTSPELYKR